MIDADRRLPLEGAVNFRDLGGYATADGRHVRRGCVYRSDSLAELTPADMTRVAALGLRSLFDLREAEERRRKPNRLHADHGVTVHEIGFIPHQASEMFAAVRAGHWDAAAVSAAVREMYRRLPLEQPAVYGAVLRGLLEPGALPALIHCTSGKDRTGFAAALVLAALGVDRDTILTDYLLTNRYRRDLSFILGTTADPAVVDMLTAAHPEYLAAAFTSIEAHWGGVDAFLEQAIGLDAGRRARLQELLLE